MNVYLHKPDDSAQTYYRITRPFKFLFNEFNMTCSSQFTEEHLRNNDVFHFSRLLQPRFMEVLTLIKKSGKKIIWEIDDDIWHIPDWNGCNVYTPDRLETIRQTLLLADEVVVSTHELKNVIGRGSVCPNLVDLDSWPEQNHEPPERDEIRILWSGSIHHAEDLKEIAPALDVILEAIPESVVYFQGDIPESMASFNRFQFSHLGFMVPHKRYGNRVKLIEPVPLEQYWQTLCDIEPDIGLAPLNDCQFNQSKSCNKAYEYYMAGATVVAADLPPYKWVPLNYRVTPGHTDKWVNAIIAAVEKRQCLRERVIHEKSWQNSEEVQLWRNMFRRLDA